MFKKILLYGMMVVTLLSLTSLTACGSNTKLVNTEYFKGKIHKKEGYVSIIGLTDLGMEQKVLSVPMYIDGLPVTTIGGNKKYMGVPETIHSDNLMKLYIPHTVNTIIYGLRIDNLREVVVNQFHLSEDYIYRLHNAEIIHPEYYRPSRGPKTPNMTFFYNYEGAPNEGYYCFDYINESSLYLLPQSPIRKNYEFVNWYLEKELITPWNEKMPESVDEVLNLYAKWDEKQE